MTKKATKKQLRKELISDIKRLQEVKGNKSLECLYLNLFQLHRKLLNK